MLIDSDFERAYLWVMVVLQGALLIGVLHTLRKEQREMTPTGDEKEKRNGLEAVDHLYTPYDDRIRALADLTRLVWHLRNLVLEDPSTVVPDQDLIEYGSFPNSTIAATHSRHYPALLAAQQLLRAQLVTTFTGLGMYREAQALADLEAGE